MKKIAHAAIRTHEIGVRRMAQAVLRPLEENGGGNQQYWTDPYFFYDQEGITDPPPNEPFFDFKADLQPGSETHPYLGRIMVMNPGLAGKNLGQNQRDEEFRPKPKEFNIIIEGIAQRCLAAMRGFIPMMDERRAPILFFCCQAHSLRPKSEEGYTLKKSLGAPQVPQHRTNHHSVSIRCCHRQEGFGSAGLSCGFGVHQRCGERVGK